MFGAEVARREQSWRGIAVGGDGGRQAGLAWELRQPTQRGEGGREIGPMAVVGMDGMVRWNFRDQGLLGVLFFSVYFICNV